MKITLDLKDFLDKEEEKKLKELFGSINKENFEDSMKKVIFAALEEYKEMFLGRGMPSRADEIQQHRLNYLILHLFGNTIPSEINVANMFHITQNKGRSLISAVLSRFFYENESRLKNTLKDVLENHDHGDGEKYILKISSKYIVDELNKSVSRINLSLPSIRKVSNSAGEYKVNKETFEKLKEDFGIDEEE